MEVLILVLGYVPLLAAIAVLLYLNFKRRKRVMMPLEKPRVTYLDLEKCGGDERAGVLEDGDIPSQRDYDYECLKNKICSILEREKLYLNPKIRVTEIAERLCTNKNYVAQAIKLKMNKNFCQLIHFYRVREAMRIYAQNPELTMVELSRSVGFNSMTTFNSAFSRNTGYTPAEWCREFKQKNMNEHE